MKDVIQYLEAANKFYHAAPTKSINSIKKNGIIKRDGKVFLTKDINYAVEIAIELENKRKTDMTIFEIDSKAVVGLRKDPEFPSGGYYITYSIKPEFVKVLGDANELAEKLL